MKAKITLLFSCLFFAIAASGQFNFDKLKDKIANPDVKNVVTEVTKLGKNALLKSKSEYDASNFNYAISLSDDAGLFESKERFDRQRNLLVAVVQSTDNDGVTPLERASQLKDAAEMLYANGKYSLSEQSFVSAKNIYTSENQQKTVAYASLLADMGLLYHSMGRYNLAETNTFEAYNLLKSSASDTSSAEAASLNNIGVLYKDMGRYNDAEKYLGLALNKNKAVKGAKSVQYAVVLNNKAMLDQMVGRTKQAETALNEALAITADLLGEKSDNYLKININLALLYQDQNKYTEAEAIYKKVIAIKERRLGTGHPDYAHYLNGLASLYMLMGNNAEVENLLLKASAIYKKKFGEASPAYATSISNLGNFYRVTGRNADAERLLAQSLNIRKQVLGENHPEYINSLYYSALMNWQLKKTSEASENFNTVFDKTFDQIKNFFAPMSEAEKTRYWDRIRPKFESYNSFVRDNYAQFPQLTTKMYNNQLATKGLLLNTTNKIKSQILAGNDKLLISDYQKWLDSKEYLARLYTYSKDELKDEKINRDSLENAVNGLEKSLSSRSSVFSSQANALPVTTENIKGKLAVGEAAVEIIQFRSFDSKFTANSQYTALIVAQDKTNPAFVLLENGSTLETRSYKLYKNNIKLKTEDESSFESYWEPIHRAIANYKKIYLSTDGIFNQVSINTLRLASGKYVIDEKNLVFLSTTKDLVEINAAAPVNKQNTATLVGNPLYGTAGKIHALPGTKKEVESINLLLKTKAYTTKLLMQADASEEQVKKITNPKWLHIATHGFFIPNITDDKGKLFGVSNEKAKENPLLRSGLMLANAEKTLDDKMNEVNNNNNGILTAYEVMNMQLDKTEMVVLSACETGLGDVKMGEGVYGLQRAFLVAGTQSLVISLWTVSDEATQMLMSSFYKKLLSGQEKNAAFRAAQLELKTKFKEPYYWGAFVMVN